MEEKSIVNHVKHKYDILGTFFIIFFNSLHQNECF
jgi:hypothetical protein